MILNRGVMITIFVTVFLVSAVPVCSAAQLYLSKSQIYGLAAFGEAERSKLLEEIDHANPDLVLVDLTREGSSVRLHASSGEYLEILSNELYSLAVYVPPGIESDISRRSGAAFRVGRVLREDEGVRFHFGPPPKPENRGLSGILSKRTRVKSVPLASEGKTASRVVLKQATPTATLGRTQVPEQPGLPDAGPAPVPVIKKQSMLKSSGGNDEPGGKRESRDVVSVDLDKKLAVVPQSPKAPSLGSARFKARAARQPRVEPLSQRVTGVGVPPPRTMRKKKEPATRVLVVSTLSGKAPILDGLDNDAAWSGVQRSVFSLSEKDLQLEAAAVTDGDHLYMLLTWQAGSPSLAHRPWTWNDSDDRYERTELLDDGVAIRWQKETPSAGVRQEFDLWVWRVGREGVSGHASDMKLLMDDKPFYMASDMKSKGGGSWGRLDFDRGRLPFEIVLPSSFSGPEVSSYAPGRPNGSASDVRSVGTWDSGRWIVEMSRALRTGHGDDIPFSREGKYAFVVNLLQGKDLKESPASEVLTLSW